MYVTEHTHSESVRHDTQLNTREVRNAGLFAVEAYVLDAQDRVVAVTNAEGRGDCPHLVLLPCLRFYSGDMRSYGDGVGAAGRRGAAEV